MSEALIIPTPYGRRKLFCGCTADRKAGVVQSTMCIGCEYHKYSPDTGTCRQSGGYCGKSTRIYEESSCSKCNGYYFIFINKSDEPEG